MKLTTICLSIGIFLLMGIDVSAQNFEIQGHRGCRGLMPENTIGAFIKALDLGVNTLELDVCITKDKKVVVSHEPYFNSLFSTKPNGDSVRKSEEKQLNIHQMTYDEVKGYDTGKRGNPRFPQQQKQAAYKPLLSEVISTCEAYMKHKGIKGVKYNIEIKSEKADYGIYQPETVTEFSDLVYTQIINQLPAERVILQSFDFDVLKYWKTNITKGTYQKVSLSALVEKKGLALTIKDLGFKPDIYSPNFKVLTKSSVLLAKKTGIRIIPWTVNEITEIKEIKALGIDGLITDYPDRALGL